MVGRTPADAKIAALIATRTDGERTGATIVAGVIDDDGRSRGGGVSRGIPDAEQAAANISDTTPKNQRAMDPLRLVSATYLNAILERAGVLDDLHVQDVTIISDRPTLVLADYPIATDT
jgi:hypothetical protein